MNISIKYKNKIITNLSAEQNIIFACKDKVMKDDIIINNGESSVIITCNDEELSSLNAGDDVVISCLGKIMKGDIVISPLSPEEPLVLSPPTISLDGDILTITDESGLAEEFDIIVDGEVKATAEAVVEPDTPEEPPEEETCTLSGTWVFNEVMGQHFIDYAQRVYFTSNGVSFTDIVISDRSDNNMYYVTPDDSIYVCNQTTWQNEAYRTITFNGEQAVDKWFYNWFTSNAVKQEETYTLIGTWVFNEELNIDSYDFFADNGEDFLFNFTSDGALHNGMTFYYLDEVDYPYYLNLAYLNNGSAHTIVWKRKSNYNWQNEAYRTITFDGEQTVSKEFYEWFITNASKQVITFKFMGDTYEADEGMTWAEWIESDYNPTDSNGVFKTFGIDDYKGTSCVWFGDDIVVKLNDSYVLPTDKVVNGASYDYEWA